MCGRRYGNAACGPVATSSVSSPKASNPAALVFEEEVEEEEEEEGVPAGAEGESKLATTASVRTTARHSSSTPSALQGGKAGRRGRVE